MTRRLEGLVILMTLREVAALISLNIVLVL